MTFKTSSGFYLRHLKSEHTKRILFFQYKHRFYLTGCRSLRNYGENCSLKCPQNCQDDYCDIVERTCLACKLGFIGPRCMGKLVWYTVISAIFINICGRYFFMLIINKMYPNVVDCIDFLIHQQLT